MTFLLTPDFTALRINLGKILDMFGRAEISPADAVADILQLCHAEEDVAAECGLDGYIARALHETSVEGRGPAWTLDHLVTIAAAREPHALMVDELA